MSEAAPPGPIRVLLVDDDPAWCSLVSAQLEEDSRIEYGGAVHYARDALDKISEVDPDVVLMDLTLPDGDGIELVREARSAGSRARFVMLSGDESIEAVTDSQKAGALGFVEKAAGFNGIRRAVLAGVSLPTA